jgi:signal transduction histidine kinase
MKQVILNLFLNACQAMPEGGTLAVESGRVNGHVEVAVKDTGVGIPPENLENIFNPFFTTKEDGTGLGLALSYAIVEQHGGAIEVDSQAGRGAVFKVKLPVGKNT